MYLARSPKPFIEETIFTPFYVPAPFLLNAFLLLPIHIPLRNSDLLQYKSVRIMTHTTGNQSRLPWHGSFLKMYTI